MSELRQGHSIVMTFLGEQRSFTEHSLDNAEGYSGGGGVVLVFLEFLLQKAPWRRRNDSINSDKSHFIFDRVIE